MDHLDSVSDAWETSMLIQYSRVQLRCTVHWEPSSLRTVIYLFFHWKRSKTLINPHKLPNASYIQDPPLSQSWRLVWDWAAGVGLKCDTLFLLHIKAMRNIDGDTA